MPSKNIIQDQLENHGLFSRMVFVANFALVTTCVFWSQKYALLLVDKVDNGLAVAGVIAAVAAPGLTLMGYSHKVYSEYRLKCKHGETD